jgi:hypothetical protein
VFKIQEVKMYRFSILMSLFAAFVVLAGCASTSELSIEDEYSAKPGDGGEMADFDFGFDISTYRIKPESAFFSIENGIPDVFQFDFMAENGVQQNSGFRVQVISTADVSEAENARRELTNWLHDEVPQYDAESYLLFRQPFYRLHVGNFRSRADAIEFSRIVKRKFPDAWVVHDQIDPNNITRKQAVVTD